MSRITTAIYYYAAAVVAVGLRPMRLSCSSRHSVTGLTEYPCGCAATISPLKGLATYVPPLY